MKTFAVIFALLIPAVCLGDVKAKAAQEAGEYILKKFGAKVVKEGAESLATRLEKAALRYGDDIFHAAKKVGPRALHLVEEAGPHGREVAKILAEFGELGAARVVTRPRCMKLVIEFGPDAAGAFIKHSGVGEPLVEKFGQAAIHALHKSTPQNARRLAMLAEDGLSPAVVEVVGKHGGDRVMEFIWRHKGAFAVTAVVTVFVANPEPFLDGTKELASIVTENAVKPVALAAGNAVQDMAPHIGEQVNWTLVILLVVCGPVIVLTLLLAQFVKLRRG